MAKFTRLVKGRPVSLSIDQEVSIPNAATSIVVTFPAAVGNSTYRVAAWIFNSTDASPQYQPVTIIARTSTTFTAAWNAPTDSANYKIMYIVPDGFVS